MRVFCVLAAAVLFSAGSAVAAENMVKVAAIFAQTGKAALNNARTLDGIKYAVDDLNRQGGVLGRQLELLIFDNSSTPLGAKIAAEMAVGAGAVTVFGAAWSSHSMAMAPILQAARIPMISPLSTSPDITRIGNYIFRTCYTDPFQGKILADFAFKDLRAKTAGVLVNVDSHYSEGLAQHFIDSFTGRGGEILFVEYHLEKTVDFSTFIRKARELKPQVLFHPGHTKVAAYVIKQARINGVEIPFLGGDGWQNSMYDLVGGYIEGNFYTSHWHHQSTLEKSRRFVEEYRRRGRDIGPAYALAADSVFLFADAAARAQSLDPADIRDAIADTRNYQGITGSISFDENGDPIKPAVILKFEGGTSAYVKTIFP